MRERPTGRHTRQVRIGDMVDVSHVEAAYDDGVLTVVMPLREETKPRRIDVNRKVLEASSA
jgi:HSP20 family protein